MGSRGAPRQCQNEILAYELLAKQREKGDIMVQINGEQVEASKVVGKTLLAYVTEAGYDPVGIVIEKNMEIIHREDFDKVNIADEDVIEILHFVGGGQF